MIKTDKIRKRQARVFYILDYLWGGFASLAIAAVLFALWDWGSTAFGEFMLPAPLDVLRRAWELLLQAQLNGLDVSLWRMAVGIGASLLLGTVFGLVAGRFATLMAMLKPAMTILLAMPPIIWVVMALFWFGFGHRSVFKKKLVPYRI